MDVMDNIALNLFPDIEGNKTFLYREDDQGYSVSYILFKTTCGTLNVDDYEKLSWAVPGSGRISCSFEKIKKILNCIGHEVKIITLFSSSQVECIWRSYEDKNGKTKRKPKYGIILSDPNKVQYNLIVGATGNY